MRAGAVLIAGLLFALAGPAAAAEKPFAFDPVRTCSGHGPGFVAVGDTTTCMRISGRVTAEAGTSIRRSAHESTSGIGSTGQVTVDVRSDTPVGPVRGVVRLKAGAASGLR